MIDIRLLGPPAISRDGVVARAPRGLKSWAVLAYLLLAERPPSRRHVAELLFADADDPLGALRWTLAELRRALGQPDAFRGDPIVADLGADVRVDVRLLRADAAIDPSPLIESSGELLDGLHIANCLEFESWLLLARRRVAATLESVLHQAAAQQLAAGRPEIAVAYAERTVALNPLDEGNQELLVRSLAHAGDHATARKQVAVCEDLFRRELGIEPSPALRGAADAQPTATSTLELSGRAAALSQLEAGRAAIAAGAVDAGLQCIRNAVAEAIRGRDESLQGHSLVVLGGALVHAVRGRDEEGTVVLHEAAQLAERTGDRETAVTAYRELGFVDVQAGRRTTAEAWLAKAEDLAETDEQLAAVLGVRGMNASDRGDYPAAFESLGESVELAASAEDPRQEAWSLSLIARAHLLRDDRAQAAEALERTLLLVQQQRWMAFLPWPQALRAELALLSGDADAAADELAQAWTLALQVGDPCWEGMAARGIGRVHLERGDHAGATTWLSEASTRCSRVPDRYQWVHAYVLDAAVSAAIERGDDLHARSLLDQLAQLSARGDMREFVVRAFLHRRRLGDESGLASARLLSADIDNPVLTSLVGAQARA